MFKKLFSKKKETVIDEANNKLIIKVPINEKVVNIEDVPDETFAQKMLGEGIAIDPTEGVVYSPVDGEVVQVFLPSKHAVGIKGDNGVEILIHVGLDTVKMNGDGFEDLISTGDKVSVGQPLIKFDIDKVRQKAKSTITPVVITNSYEYKEVISLVKESTVIGQNLIEIKK